MSLAPQGPAHVARLASAVANPRLCLTEAVRELGGVLLKQITGLNAKIGELETRLRESALQDDEAKRLMSIPGIRAISVSPTLLFQTFFSERSR